MAKEVGEGLGPGQVLLRPVQGLRSGASVIDDPAVPCDQAARLLRGEVIDHAKEMAGADVR